MGKYKTIGHNIKPIKVEQYKTNKSGTCRVCLIHMFKHIMYFYMLFHLYGLPKNTNNISIITLPNGS